MNSVHEPGSRTMSKKKLTQEQYRVKPRVSQRATGNMDFSVPSGTSNSSKSPRLNCTFQELSNEYSHAQIRVKMKKLWPRQVGEEKQAAVSLSGSMSRQELCRDQCRDKKYVATSVATSSMSRPVSRQAVCRDKQYVVTSVATSSMSRPVSRPESFVATRKFCRDQKC